MSRFLGPSTGGAGLASFVGRLLRVIRITNVSRINVNSSFSNKNKIGKYGKSGSFVGVAIHLLRRKFARASVTGV